MEWIPYVLVIACFLFVTRRWFWLLLVSFCALASFFAMIASLFNFRILAAIGFFILWVFFSFLAKFVTERYKSLQQ